MAIQFLHLAKPTLGLALRDIERRARDELLIEELSLAVEVTCGGREVATVLFDLCRRLLDVCVLGTGIERDEQLACAYELAFADVNFAHRAGDLRAQIDRLKRNHAAVGAQAHRYVAAFDVRGEDGHRGLSLALGAVAGPGARQPPQRGEIATATNAISARRLGGVMEHRDRVSAVA